MADKTYEIQIITTKVGDGAASAENDLDKLTTSAEDAGGALDDVSKKLESVGEGVDTSEIDDQFDALRERLDGASEAAEKTKNSTGDLNDVVGDLGKQGGAARDVIHGLESAMKGSSTAAPDLARAWASLNKALQGANPALLASGILLTVGTAVVNMIRDTKKAEEQLNALGETADEERERLEKLNDTELDFKNARDGLSKLREDFDTTTAAQERLRNADRGARAAERARELDSLPPEQRAAKQQQFDISDQEEKIRDTQEAIRARLQLQLDEQDALNAILEQTTAAQVDYLKKVTQLKNAGIDAEDLSTEQIGEEIKKLERELRRQTSLAAGIEATNFGPGNLGPAFQRRDPRDAQRGIDNAQGSLDALRSLEEAKVFADESIEQVQKAKEEFATDMEALSVEVVAFGREIDEQRQNLAQTLEQAIAEAQQRVTSSRANLGSAQGDGATALASQEYSNAIAALANLQQRLAEVEGKIGTAGQAVVDEIRTFGNDLESEAGAGAQKIQAAGAGAKQAVDDAVTDVTGAAGALTAATDAATGQMTGAIKSVESATVSGFRELERSLIDMMRNTTNTMQSLSSQVRSIASQQSAITNDVNRLEQQVKNRR